MMINAYVHTRASCYVFHRHSQCTEIKIAGKKRFPCSTTFTIALYGAGILRDHLLSWSRAGSQPSSWPPPAGLLRSRRSKQVSILGLRELLRKSLFNCGYPCIVDDLVYHWYGSLCWMVFRYRWCSRHALSRVKRLFQRASTSAALPPRCSRSPLATPEHVFIINNWYCCFPLLGRRYYVSKYLLVAFVWIHLF